MKIILIMLALFVLRNPAYAESIEDHIKILNGMVQSKQYDQAINYLDKALKEYPDSISLKVALADSYASKGEYAKALEIYLPMLKSSNQFEKETQAYLHQSISRIYYSIAMEHYFTEDVSLRIIFHLLSFYEISKESIDLGSIEILRRMVGHYTLAKTGPNVKMIDGNGDGKEFVIPVDYVSLDDKILYKDKAVSLIDGFDVKLKKMSYQTTNSDKSFKQITELIASKYSKIKTINFRKSVISIGSSNTLEEVFYKEPNKLKAIEPNVVSIINGSNYYVLDPISNKLSFQDRLDISHFSPLRTLGFINLNEFIQSYNLTIEKVAGCPDFLNELCKDSPLELYLIVGQLKDGVDMQPVVPRIEFFIDVNTGLCVSKREYWHGILGSGRKEELVKEYRINKITQRSEGLSFALLGEDFGYVQELESLNNKWIINVNAINQSIDEKIFDIKK